MQALKHNIQPLGPESKTQQLWNYRKQMADHYNTADAFQLLYQHHLKARRVTDYLIYTTSKREAEEDTHDQEQYLTEYKSLIMEKWAIPYLAHIDYHLDTQRPISRE